MSLPDLRYVRRARVLKAGLEPDTVLRPWMRVQGRSSGYARGAARIIVTAAGEFTWSRPARKSMTVYVATSSGLARSNQVRLRCGRG